MRLKRPPTLPNPNKSKSPQSELAAKDRPLLLSDVKLALPDRPVVALSGGQDKRDEHGRHCSRE